MEKILCISLVIFLVGYIEIRSTLSEDINTVKFNYPVVRRDENVVDDYHGTKISDPYRWLETPDSEETKKFIAEQNNLTYSYINATPVHAAIKKRLAEIMDYEKINCPTKAGDRFYYRKNSGLQNQAVYYVQDSVDGEPREFLDPNKLSEDGTARIHSTHFSDDGELLAYGIQQSGSDWITLHFKNATSGEKLPDQLQYLKFTSVEWNSDNSGVFYIRYPTPSGASDGSETEVVQDAKVYYHSLGTNQTEDVLLADFPENPKLILSLELSDDDKYLLISAEHGIGTNTMYYANLEEPLFSGNEGKLNLTPIITEFNAFYSYITNNDAVFYFHTDKDAPNSKIIGIDVNQPEEKYWSTLVPEHPKDNLYTVSTVGNDYLVLNYIRDVTNVLELRHLSNGTLIKTLTTGEHGQAYNCDSGDREDTELFYSFTSYLTPKRIYFVNITDDLSVEPKLWKESKLKGFDANEYQSQQVFYESFDGTRVPMYIIHRKHLELNGELPTKLYGYGGYGVSELPAFSSDLILLMQNFNGVAAIANIRGGGEYGKKWWDDGRLLNKQKSFNDFQAAAEYLIANNYTNPSKLFINGASNGGLLVGACLTQRPELYGAVVVDVGIIDMLRYQHFTIGYAWCTEFGCSEEKEHFDNLFKYSPLHNIRLAANESVQYPAVLVNTADHDDRVVPLHSYKFLSELQHKIGRSERQTKPLLLRVEFKAGHGGGKPISKQIEETADTYAFLVQSLGYKFHE